MADRVGDVEVDGEEGSTDGGNGREKQDSLAHPVWHPLPRDKGDDGTGKKSYSSENLRNLDRIAEIRGVWNDGAAEKATIPRGTFGNPSTSVAPSPEGKSPRTTLTSPEINHSYHIR